jgi:aminoglycoside phosphotransferase family enzyme
VTSAIGHYRAAPLEIDARLKLAFLGSAAAYGRCAAPVERVETHFSWLFLTDRHVFKLKKPVRGAGFDFSSLAGRLRNARAEIRLNRRLAPGIYLGVVPLTLGRNGLALAGEGTPVDWLVQMVRLPAERMLDRCLVDRTWSLGEIHALGARLAKFFVTARRAHIEPKAYLDRFREECRVSRRTLHQFGGPALRLLTDRLTRRLEAFIVSSEHLPRRVESGRIADGHGDLRPEHICLGSPPSVIDCLEFRSDLRCLDPVDELAFLAMECERLGASGIGPILFYRYRRRSGDRPPPVLIAFYRAIGALIRARIAMLHLQEFPVGDPTKWSQRAAGYLAIARREARRLAS